MIEKGINDQRYYKSINPPPPKKKKIKRKEKSNFHFASTALHLLYTETFIHEHNLANKMQLNEKQNKKVIVVCTGALAGCSVGPW